MKLLPFNLFNNARSKIDRINTTLIQFDHSTDRSILVPINGTNQRTTVYGGLDQLRLLRLIDLVDDTYPAISKARIC